MSYVVQPDRYAQSLAKIRAAARAAGRALDGFTPAHLPFVTLGRDRAAARATWVRILSRRYNQDFGPLAERYGIMGTPGQVLEQLGAFVKAGCRYFTISIIEDAERQREQLETFASEVLPQLRAL
jgi:alkanesulfonate monooxygenase SsuD/methylene tetrahydromethanopterin reductase-like flavin-dependent oxidoreductase (luciferase family)